MKMTDDMKIPFRTLDQVRDCLARDRARSKKGKRIDLSMARLMLRHGRLTPEARAYVEDLQMTHDQILARLAVLQQQLQLLETFLSALETLTPRSNIYEIRNYTGAADASRPRRRGD